MPPLTRSCTRKPSGGCPVAFANVFAIRAQVCAVLIARHVERDAAGFRLVRNRAGQNFDNDSAVERLRGGLRFVRR